MPSRRYLFVGQRTNDLILNFCDLLQINFFFLIFFLLRRKLHFNLFNVHLIELNLNELNSSVCAVSERVRAHTQNSIIFVYCVIRNMNRYWYLHVYWQKWILLQKQSKRVRDYFEIHIFRGIYCVLDLRLRNIVRYRLVHSILPVIWVLLMANFMSQWTKFHSIFHVVERMHLREKILNYVLLWMLCAQ